MTADYLADLTPAQYEAVTHVEGPLLVLAGPGSGKTRVLTRRVAHLINQGIRPWSILAITFTNKAAGEMRQRIESLLPGSRVWISTFHALGARLLRQYGERIGLDRRFTIYDQSDRTRMVKHALEAANIDNVRFTPETIQAAISKAKNDLIGPDKYAREAFDFFRQTVAHVYPVYEKRMRDANALDFDDLLYWPALALQNDPELRAELDSRFRFVLIDEYQDTNKAQYAIARNLCRDQPNLCVVGDPDQSIYKFRGSDIRNILDFERDFPDTRVIRLDRNYRSTRAILQAASHLIAHNTQRKPMNLVTENGQGQSVTVLTYETSQDEAEGIAQRLANDVRSGKRAYRDFALFLRVNALSRTIESAFIQHRIPYQIIKGFAFYDRKEVRDVLAYLRLLVNPRDDLSFLRAINEPARGIGKVSLEHLRNYAEPREISLLEAAGQVERIPAIKGKAVKGLLEFARLMGELFPLAEAPPDECIRQVLDKSGYRRLYQNSTEADDQERLANIEELITAAHQLTEQDSSNTLATFLENLTLASDIDGWDEVQDSVSIMTLHAAKGLEFPVVYMLAVEEGLLPHERSLAKNDEIEEERRLAFVGMTRAKEELYLAHARMREYRGQTLYTVPSMFLQELPEDGVESIDLSSSAAGTARAIEDWRDGGPAARPGWAEAGISPRYRPETPREPGSEKSYVEGMHVRHDSYGLGRITHVSGYGAMRKVKIRFHTYGEKTFIADKVKLAIVRSS
jgi:DNA helicase-2/ATP-dependent DNA helicase PcrA